MPSEQLDVKQPETILRLPEVMARTGLSRPTLYRAAKRGEFPKPLRISRRFTGWREGEVAEWIASREPIEGY